MGTKASEKVFGKTNRKAMEIEQLTAELKKVEEETKTLKQKYAAACARLTNLDREVKEMKVGDVQRMKLLLEKSENDDRLIGALKDEIQRLRKMKESSTSAARQEETPAMIKAAKSYVFACKCENGIGAGERTHDGGNDTAEGGDGGPEEGQGHAAGQHRGEGGQDRGAQCRAQWHGGQVRSAAHGKAPDKEEVREEST